MKINLLLIEDSDDDKVLITEFLKGAGFDVNYEVVVDEQGMRGALSHDLWDVIVCDHYLPGFSSFRALEILHESGKEVPLLVVSGVIDDRIAIDSLNAGAFDYVMKDNLIRLPSAIRNAITAYDLLRKQKLANQEIDASRRLLRRLSEHLQNAREQERERFARDIHDDLGSNMAALKIDLKWLIKRVSGKDQIIDEKLEAMTRLVDSAISSVRQVITEMRPSMIDDLGLMATIEWQLDEFGKRNALAVEMDRNCDDIGFDDKALEISIFRIFQEALNNIAKHANATHVVVRVLDSGDRLVLEVEDDGCGFDADIDTRIDSFGIISMSERALVMDGDVDVNSTPGGGTKVKLTVPIIEEQRS